MTEERTIDVLGVTYSLHLTPEADDPKLETMDGYTDPSIKRIVVSDVHERPPADDDVQNMEWFQKNIIRHELIHAFVIESGCQDALWHSEEMVRWLAYMFPRLLAAFNEAGALYERLPKPFVEKDIDGEIVDEKGKFITADELRKRAFIQGCHVLTETE